MRVAETFVSRQGEGKLTGQPSFFIRSSGCNLRCWFCDTPYASWRPEGEVVEVRTLVEAALASGCGHVVLTGGEPLLSPASVPLAAALRDAGLHLTIETAGTVDRGNGCDLLSLSPKLASSGPDPRRHARWARLHETRRLPLDVMEALIGRAAEVQLKFVVDRASDFDEIGEIVTRLNVPPRDVWIMPQGTTDEALDRAAEWLRPRTGRAGYVYCDRMQIRWYGDRRGT